MLVLPRYMLVIPIGDTLCSSIHTYLSPLTKPMARVIALPFYHLHPLRPICYLGGLLKLTSRQLQPSIQKVQGMVEHELSDLSTGPIGHDKNGGKKGDYLSNEHSPNNEASPNKEDSLNNEDSPNNEDSSDKVQKLGMDYKFFITGLLGKSAITSNKNPPEL